MLVTQNDVNVNAHQQQMTTVKKTKESCAKLNPRKIHLYYRLESREIGSENFSNAIESSETQIDPQVFEKPELRGYRLIFDRYCKGLYFQSELSR